MKANKQIRKKYGTRREKRRNKKIFRLLYARNKRQLKSKLNEALQEMADKGHLVDYGRGITFATDLPTEQLHYFNDLLSQAFQIPSTLFIQ